MPKPVIVPPMPPDPEVVEALQLDAPPRRRWPWLVGVALAVGVAVVVALSARPPISDAFETTQAVRGDLVLRVTAVGTVEPRDAVDIASELSGIVREVLVDVNAPVRAGQVLARLDSDLLAAQVRQADAQRRAAEAALVQARVIVDNARAEKDRAEQLAAQGAVTKSALDAARSTWRQAVAGLGVAEANAASAQAAAQITTINLERADISSPIDGVLLDRQVEPGQAVVSSLQAQTLFRVAADLDRMDVVVAVDEADIARVREGQQATFTVAAHGDRPFPATVAEVKLSPRTAQQVVTYEATLRVDNADRALVPGMTATATIVTDTVRDAVLVPGPALRFAPTVDTAPPPAPGTSRIWVADGDVAVPRDVTLGPTDGAATVVVSGLEDGEPVILRERTLKERRGKEP